MGCSFLLPGACLEAGKARGAWCRCRPYHGGAEVHCSSRGGTSIRVIVSASASATHKHSGCQSERIAQFLRDYHAQDADSDRAHIPLRLAGGTSSRPSTAVSLLRLYSEWRFASRLDVVTVTARLQSMGLGVSALSTSISLGVSRSRYALPATRSQSARVTGLIQVTGEIHRNDRYWYVPLFRTAPPIPASVAPVRMFATEQPSGTTDDRYSYKVTLRDDDAMITA